MLLLRLRETRRRLAAQRTLDAAALATLAGGSLLFALAAFHRTSPAAAVVLAVIAAGAAASILWGVFGAPDLPRAAALLDARGGTRDRFRTALDFAARPTPTPLETLALAECERFARDFPVRLHTPIRLPRRIAWALLPLAGGALIAAGLFTSQPSRATALDAAMHGRAAELQKLAASLRQNPSPELARVAEALEKSAARLKTSAAPDTERQKAALREMSSLEAMLNALKAARELPVSPAELSALAAALAANDSTKLAAESLRKGELGAAASQLEKALQALQERGDPAGALEQLARSLQEGAAKLTAAEKNEIARQMGQAGQSGASSLRQQALSRLAQLLRQAGQNGAGQASGPGRAPTEREVQSLLAALADLKDGLRPGGGDKPGAKGEGAGSLAAMESFSPKPAESAGKTPAGQPGSEHDGGHTPPGEGPPSAVKAEGPATRLTGAAGEGESLQQFIGAASDSSRATRAYRENYDRLAPTEQNAIEQESIPLGSRRFVRRYFENIRPAE